MIWKKIKNALKRKQHPEINYILPPKDLDPLSFKENIPRNNITSIILSN